MRVSIFLSHSSSDKPFARRLARDLDNQGVTYWLDEAEIKIGDYLIDKIRSELLVRRGLKEAPIQNCGAANRNQI